MSEDKGMEMKTHGESYFQNVLFDSHNEFDGYTCELYLPKDIVPLNSNQKVALAAWIAEANQGAITGSVMLFMRGIYLGREIGDIDILVEDTSPDDIVLPPLCERIEGHDEEGYKVLARAYFFGNKIEFIHVDEIRADPHSFRLDGKSKIMKVARVEDLVAAKEFYLYNCTNEEYKEKTRRDLEVIDNHFSTSI
ncbi:hypothetical protein [Bacteroides reticulotermitis]|uniref:hypothetical protein n=1 Tax=Bacteroides reticulotermitis TaxID=1133319 RepID=UPI003A86FC79